MEYVSVSAIVCIDVVIFRLFVYEGRNIHFGRLVEMLNRSLVPRLVYCSRKGERHVYTRHCSRKGAQNVKICP
jgi:hypothetical protein